MTRLTFVAVATAVTLWSVGDGRAQNTTPSQRDILRRYPKLLATHADAKLARRVFDRVMRAAPGLSAAATELLVVEGRDVVAAMALPDSTIVVTEGAIDGCRRWPAATEALLGFVMGHELAHLEKHHYQDAALFFGLHILERSGDGSISETVLQSLRVDLGDAAGLALREREADVSAIKRVVQAGFDVGALLEHDFAFFREWIRHTDARRWVVGSDVVKRSAAIRAELAQLGDKLDLFEIGTRYLELGRYDDARRLLRPFATLYQGAEASNNLGLAELGVALRKLSAHPNAARKRFPGFDSARPWSVVVAPRSFERRHLPGWTEVSATGAALADADRQIKNAESAFRLAVRAGDSAGYRNNLGVSLAIRGQWRGALLHFDAAAELDPTHEAVKLNRERVVSQLAGADVVGRPLAVPAAPVKAPDLGAEPAMAGVRVGASYDDVAAVLGPPATTHAAELTDASLRIWRYSELSVVFVNERVDLVQVTAAHDAARAQGIGCESDTPRVIPLQSGATKIDSQKGRGVQCVDGKARRYFVFLPGT